MKIEVSKMSLKELAGFVTKKLKENGIDCILVGGACVTIYSKNKYLSYVHTAINHAKEPYLLLIPNTQ